MCAAIWMMLDLIWMIVGAWLAHAWTISPSARWDDWDVTLVSAGSLLLLLAFAMSGVYARKHRRKPIAAITRTNLIAILAWAIANRATLAMKLHRPDSFEWLDEWLITSQVLMIATRLIFGQWIRRIDRKHPYRRRVIVAGDVTYLDQWLRVDSRKVDDYVITGAFAADAAQRSEHHLPLIKNIDCLVDLAKSQQFDELWLALPMSSQEEISGYVTALQHHFVDIRLFSDVQKLPLFNPSATTMAGTTFIDLVTSPQGKDENVWWKSVFDRVFALFVLSALSPALLAIAILVKCTSPGPVFFRQRRKGADGREFTIFKFRSMRVHTEAAGKLTQASKNDKRVTPLGRMLRKTSIDELPQFINVLLGQMSVVGPRPHALEHDDFYMRLIDGYMYRYRIKPGITGWAQINGARGETIKIESMARRVALDLFYIQNWSFWLDLRIVSMTIVKGFTNKNAY